MSPGEIAHQAISLSNGEFTISELAKFAAFLLFDTNSVKMRF